jgi:hypothetical protein
VKFPLFLTLLLAVGNIALSQPGPTMQSTPQPTLQSQREIRNQRTDQTMRPGEVFVDERSREARLTERRASIFKQNIKPLYRKLTKSELKLMAPMAEDLKTFASLLKLPNTGLAKFVNTAECAEDTEVLSALPKCHAYYFPGAGASFSFRERRHRLRRLSDLLLAGENFYSPGVLMQGILVNLGQVPIEQITIGHRVVKTLTNFETAKTIPIAQKEWDMFAAGVEKDGLLFKSNMPVRVGETYLLRSIAYRGRFIRTVSQVVYNEIDYDDRKDIIVAFQVIRKDADESVTIFWKELRSNDSPRLELEPASN